MKQNLIGIDVGGTKCAVIYGRCEGGGISVADKIKFPTADAAATINGIMESVAEIMAKNGLEAADVKSIGVSCGGPLDSAAGVVMSPPNLPGWDNVPIVAMLEERFRVPAAIHNDANACALAEWKFGAGRGYKNVIFLTFGTGMGSGLILDGKLYAGTNDNAGEIGHVRLSGFGPVGYGKAGSFEGFCSGSGIAQLAAASVRERLQMGEKVPWCDADGLDSLTARDVAEAAKAGDKLARKVVELSARKLGEGLSVLIDVLNPEVIVIGSIYTRYREMMEPVVLSVIEEEALPLAAKACAIKPAELGEAIGDYAALSVAANNNKALSET